MTLKRLKSQWEKKPRCRVQVAWPLRHPGVDRPVFVSLSLSSPLGFPSYPFFLSCCICLLWVFSFTFSIHIITWCLIATPSPPSTTLLHRVSGVPSHCRCGSISCVGFVVTCGQSFRQTWLRMCLDRFCQRLYRSWCKDMPEFMPHIKDTCKSGILSCVVLILYRYPRELLLAFSFRGHRSRSSCSAYCFCISSSTAYWLGIDFTSKALLTQPSHLSRLGTRTAKT